MKQNFYQKNKSKRIFLNIFLEDFNFIIKNFSKANYLLIKPYIKLMFFIFQKLFLSNNKIMLNFIRYNLFEHILFCLASIKIDCETSKAILCLPCFPSALENKSNFHFLKNDFTSGISGFMRFQSFLCYHKLSDFRQFLMIRVKQTLFFVNLWIRRSSNRVLSPVSSFYEIFRCLLFRLILYLFF